METCWESLKQELEENSNYFKGLLSGSLLLQETSTDDKYDDQNLQISSSEISLHKVWHFRWLYISRIKLPNYYWEEISLRARTLPVILACQWTDLGMNAMPIKVPSLPLLMPSSQNLGSEVKLFLLSEETLPMLLISKAVTAALALHS